MRLPTVVLLFSAAVACKARVDGAQVRADEAAPAPADMNEKLSVIASGLEADMNVLFGAASHERKGLSLSSLPRRLSLDELDALKKKAAETSSAYKEALAASDKADAERAAALARLKEKLEATTKALASVEPEDTERYAQGLGDIQKVVDELKSVNLSARLPAPTPVPSGSGGATPPVPAPTGGTSPGKPPTVVDGVKSSGEDGGEAKGGASPGSPALSGVKTAPGVDDFEVTVYKRGGVRLGPGELSQDDRDALAERSKREFLTVTRRNGQTSVSRIKIYVPAPDAKVFVDGRRVGEEVYDVVRLFHTPSLASTTNGFSYYYDVQVEWIANGTTHARKQRVVVDGGMTYDIDLARD